MLLRPGASPRPATSASVEIIRGDLGDLAALRTLVEGCDAVIHLAGAIRGRGPEDFHRVNVQGTRNLLEAVSIAAPHTHFINVSSLAAREPGLSWYAASKAEGEQAVAERARNWTSLRPPVVYGPGDPALAPLWKLAARGWLPVPGSPDNRFSMIHVDDVVQALLQIMTASDAARSILTIHDGEPKGYDWHKIASVATEHRGRSVRVVRFPAEFLQVLATLNLALSRWYPQAPVMIPGKVRELVHPDWFCDNAALQEFIAWNPQIGLRRALNELPGWGKQR